MKIKHIAVILAAFVFVAPSFARAAEVQKSVESKPVAESVVVAKTPVKKTVAKAVSCVRCASLAEGPDRSTASKATVWVGTVIGVNAGSHDVIITEANALNHIKAYQQRNISVGANTKITTKSGDEKNFDYVDIGYRVEVKGSYDAKTRTIKASSVEIVKVPDAPITKTK